MTTSQQTNWKNVNNWHWVTKNCGPWTQTYFKDGLKDVEAKKTAGSGEIVVKTTKVDEVSGDVELNQRKGKPITIFDVSITIAWEGEQGDEKASGTVKFPEYMNDQDFDDIDIEISVDGSSPEKLAMKNVVKTELVPKLIEKLKQFPNDLLASHVKDVVIPEDQMKGHPTTTAPYKPQPVPAPNSTSSQTTTQLKGSTTTFEQDVEFVCSAADLFQALVDQQRVRIWSRSNAEIKPEAGSLFSLFDGQVSGYTTAVENNKQLIQRWRLKSWPASHFATVTMTLEQGSDNCKLKLKATEVPTGEVDQVQANFTNYYWNPIKSTFGYGALL